MQYAVCLFIFLEVYHMVGELITASKKVFKLMITTSEINVPLYLLKILIYGIYPSVTYSSLKSCILLEFPTDIKMKF